MSLVALSGTAAWASPAEEQQGAALLAQVQNGQTSCSALSANQSELIGEYVMGRMLGSTVAHNAMNARLKAVTGDRGERQAHQFLGRRFAGCATGHGPATVGTMMGMMGSGMTGAGYGGSGSSGAGGGFMMGGGYGSSQGTPTGSLGAGGIIAIILGVIALLALSVVVAFRKGVGHRAGPGAA